MYYKKKSYVISEIPEVSDVMIEKLNTKSSNMSVKVAVDFRHKDQITKEDFWPNGIIIRRYNFRSSDFLGMKLEPEWLGSVISVSQTKTLKCYY